MACRRGPNKNKIRLRFSLGQFGHPSLRPLTPTGGYIYIYIYIYMGKNGWPLQKLIDELNSGEVDPLRHPDVELEVVRKLYGRHYRYYSNDNRRLYYLEKHQQRVQP